MSETVTTRIQKVKKNTIKARLFFFLALVVILLLVTIFSEQLAPYDPYEQDLSIKIENIVNAITENTRIVVLLNPNNPIGNVYTEEELAAVIRPHPTFSEGITEAVSLS